MRIDDDFLPEIGHLDLAVLDAAADVVYFLDAGLRLRGYNSAWEAFALANDGAEVLQRYGLGCCVVDASPALLQAIYRAEYLSALGSKEPVERDFQCSSPSEFRLYHQTVYPLPEKHGLMLTNHLLVAGPHPEPPMGFSSAYLNAGGVVVQCSHCRKLRFQSTPERWDWVPSAVEHPLADISHGLCAYCLEHYYPEPHAGDDEPRPTS